jgi:hypothetical protein
MFLDDSWAGASGETGGPRTARQIEFVEALHRYMASYMAEQRRRVRGARRGGWLTDSGTAASRRLARRAVRRLTAVMLEALQRLGGAISGGGFRRSDRFDGALSRLRSFVTPDQ